MFDTSFERSHTPNTKAQSTTEPKAERCVICGVPRPKVPGPATYPPYYCLKHREHIEGKRCIDPECPVCVKGEPAYAEHATTPAAPAVGRWSKASPKVNGVYWWRADARDADPDIHRVVDGIFFEVGEQFSRVVEGFGGEWLGPIAPTTAITPVPASTAPVVDSDEPVSDADRWKRDLTAAGWHAESATAWRAPDGGLWRGPFGAWKELQRRAKATGTDTNWPLRDVLTQLVEWAKHLHDDHECDCHGWGARSFLIEAATGYAADATAACQVEPVNRDLLSAFKELIKWHHMAAKHGGSANECEWAVCVGYKQIAEDCDAAPVEQSEHIEAIDCYAPYRTSSSTSARAAAEEIDEATMDWALSELANGWIQNNEREGFYQNARRVLNAIVNRT